MSARRAIVAVTMLAGAALIAAAGVEHIPDIAPHLERIRERAGRALPHRSRSTRS
jgi:hypothetical protein